MIYKTNYPDSDRYFSKNVQLFELAEVDYKPVLVDEWPLRGAARTMLCMANTKLQSIIYQAHRPLPM